jgi:hypothetical protein
MGIMLQVCSIAINTDGDWALNECISGNLWSQLIMSVHIDKKNMNNRVIKWLSKCHNSVITISKTKKKCAFNGSLSYLFYLPTFRSIFIYQ